MSPVFWFLLIVVILLAVVIYVTTRPRHGIAGEADRRMKAAKKFNGTDDERMWFYAGWDDHFMHAQPRNRPNDARLDPKLKMAYDEGYKARLDWSREFAR